ncbi:MAG: hypothetical protein GC159_04945 [Phycisphaera sp.]|nr:hypothetical protein [Phycisphaera sp.]
MDRRYDKGGRGGGGNYGDRRGGGGGYSDRGPQRGGDRGGKPYGGNPRPLRKPPLLIQPTTLWDYPSQHYGDGDEMQGDREYRGATPSYIIWNLLQRYTREGDLVIDPCCGSGTTLDVARDLKRKALGYDVNPQREDIFNVDARKLPPELTGKVDFVFIDPPYSTHIDYSDDPRCIGKLDASNPEGGYYEAMEQVIGEIARVLKPGAYMGLYVSDSFVKGGERGGFEPIGFELFALLRKRLEPVDIVSVVRHNKTLEMGNYRRAAEEGNFYLRGFNYLFIMRKPGKGRDIKVLRGEERATGKLSNDTRRPVAKATGHYMRRGDVTGGKNTRRERDQRGGKGGDKPYGGDKPRGGGGRRGGRGDK